MLWAILTVLGVLLVVWFLHLNRRPVLKTEDEILVVLNSWLNDTISSGEWDYFENCEIQNPKLEAIRKRCAELSIDPALTVNPKASSLLNAKGKVELSRIIAALNTSLAAAPPNPSFKRDA
ncbi:MAG TPA: hypothetical protein DCO68_09660 [Methylophilaceae bacterium]|nr:hypothetical protein [Methylophilaceae bacterium]HAJ72329.1 hypothetical protein [Methylophilaceae bacterium]